MKKAKDIGSALRCSTGRLGAGVHSFASTPLVCADSVRTGTADPPQGYALAGPAERTRASSIRHRTLAIRAAASGRRGGWRKGLPQFIALSRTDLSVLCWPSEASSPLRGRSYRTAVLDLEQERVTLAAARADRREPEAAAVPPE